MPPCQIRRKQSITFVKREEGPQALLDTFFSFYLSGDGTCHSTFGKFVDHLLLELLRNMQARLVDEKLLAGDLLSVRFTLHFGCTNHVRRSLMARNLATFFTLKN